ELIGRKYQRRTKQTLTTFAQLAADLRLARQAGVAYDGEEHSLGVCAAGVALRDPLGNFIAISVPVPTQRFQDEFKLITKRLLDTKAALEHQLTARPVCSTDAPENRVGDAA